MEGERSVAQRNGASEVRRVRNGVKRNIARPVITRYLQWVMIEVKYFAATRFTDCRSTNRELVFSRDLLNR
jgi:hypothetical protein